MDVSEEWLVFLKAELNGWSGERNTRSFRQNPSAWSCAGQLDRQQWIFSRIGKSSPALETRVTVTGEQYGGSGLADQVGGGGWRQNGVSAAQGLQPIGWWMWTGTHGGGWVWIFNRKNFNLEVYLEKNNSLSFSGIDIIFPLAGRMEFKVKIKLLWRSYNSNG